MEIHGTTGVDGEALVDQKMIGLVLDHLLYNAVQHTPSGTRVDVTVSSDERSVQIAVDDDGPGISDELLPYLFERLYRADLARTRSPGAGLGLTISAAILDAHNGSIAAAPSKLGGLQVILELPRAAPNAAPDSGPPPPA